MKLAIASDVLRQELPPNASSRHHSIVAVVATPLGKVVCNVKSSRRRHRVFIVNKVDTLGFALGSTCAVCGRECYHVGAEKVAVGKYQLASVNLSVQMEKTPTYSILADSFPVIEFAHNTLEFFLQL